MVCELAICAILHQRARIFQMAPSLYIHMYSKSCVLISGNLLQRGCHFGMRHWASGYRNICQAISCYSSHPNATFFLVFWVGSGIVDPDSQQLCTQGRTRFATACYIYCIPRELWCKPQRGRWWYHAVWTTVINTISSGHVCTLFTRMLCCSWLVLTKNT